MERAAVSIFAAKSQKVVIGLVATTWTALLNTFILNARKLKLLHVGNGTAQTAESSHNLLIKEKNNVTFNF